MQTTPDFEPTRTAGLSRLQTFLPRAGKEYAARRNYDFGPGHHTSVSTLSPYLRHRLVTEKEVLQAVLGRYALSTAEKFVQEVFWRTYSKGWLEQRPAVWTGYQQGVRQAWNGVQTQGGLRADWEAACKGETGIDAFDHWARELATTGYLHNHARMWFASIWIFTLRLPWELGADFFLRHLLDGDPASNTMGWRWVAGLQTRGKTYLARASNIAKYTENRFNPSGLATEAPALDGPAHPDRRDLPPDGVPDTALKTGYLLHTEDLSPRFAIPAQAAPVAVLRTEARLSPLQLAPRIGTFLDGAVADLCGRLEITPDIYASEPDQITEWARSHGVQQLVTAYAPVGPAAALLDEIESRAGLPVVRVRRAYDSAAWPCATSGFFRFKKQIPRLISEMTAMEPAG